MLAETLGYRTVVRLDLRFQYPQVGSCSLKLPGVGQERKAANGLSVSSSRIVLAETNGVHGKWWWIVTFQYPQVGSCSLKLRLYKIGAHRWVCFQYPQVGSCSLKHHLAIWTTGVD